MIGLTIKKRGLDISSLFMYNGDMNCESERSVKKWEKSLPID